MAEKIFLVDFNLNGNQIKNVVVEKLATAPANPVAGRIYFDTTTNEFKYYNGTTWIAGAKYSASSLAEDASNQYKIYDSDNGNTFQFRAIKGGNNITLSATDGVIEIAVSGLTKSSVGLGNVDNTADADKPVSTAQQQAITAAVDAAKDELNQAIQNVNNAASQKVASVTAGDKSVVIGGTATAPNVAAQISKGEGNALSLADDGLMVTIPEEVPYTGAEAIAVEGKEISLVINPADKVLAQSSTGLLATIGLNYDSSAKEIQLIGTDGNAFAQIDASDFIKDGFLQSVNLEVNPAGQAEGTYLHFVWNTDAGITENYLNVTSLIDVYTAGNGIAINGKAVSVVIDPASETFLTVGAAGVKLSGVQDAIDSAKSDAISTAAGDATEKANQALAAAKEYADGLSSGESMAHEYVHQIAVGSTSPVTIAASTHGCGQYPLVQVYQGGNLVDAAVSIVDGAVTVAWNGTLATALVVKILGVTNASIVA